MIKISSIVPKASMNMPCAIEVPAESSTTTARGPGSMQDTRAAATIPPSSWAGRSTTPLTQGTLFVRHSERVTCVVVCQHEAFFEVYSNTYCGVEESA